MSIPQSLKNSADSIRMSRGIPGMAFAIFTGDSIIAEGVVGYRQFHTHDSIRMRDRFDVGTNAAAFTSYIAGRMVESGKINWDTKFLDVYPEFKKKVLPVYEGLTLSALLSNRSRIPPYALMDDWYKIPNIVGKTMSEKRRKLSLFLLGQKPVMENLGPAQKPFSVSGYVIAASMLEKVAGKKWENLVVQYINEPLNISVKFGWPNEVDTAEPFGHWFQANYFHAEEPNTWLRPNPLLYPAREINISLPDYVIFMQENLRALQGKKSRLSQENMEYIHFGILDYSMGWHNGALGKYSFSFQEGESPLFDCRVEVLKEKNIGIIVVCNSGDRDGKAGVLNLTRILESYALSL
jgi:CubicO group peptidase (beta-lactamase class C family)